MPQRCPECGRFLAADFVEGLREQPAPCPRCEEVLTPDRFDGPTEEAAASGATPASTGSSEVLADAAPGAPSPRPRGRAERGRPARSVRPPDLPPDEVRVEDPDAVLAGWDETGLATVREMASGANLSIVAAIIAAGVGGGLLGGLVASRRRPAWTVAGTLAGAALAVLGSRILEEEDTFS